MMLVLEQRLIAKSAFKNKLPVTTVEEVYQRCFYEYFEKLYAYAFTIVKDNAEAKDIVQAAYIKLWEKRTEVNLLVSARSYLYTAVYHLALNTVRNRKIREGHHLHLVPKIQLEKISSAEEKEIRLRIEQVISELPPRCREVFLKSRFEGKRYAEIASDLAISVKTVEVQMGKALKFLREKLADLLLVCIINLFT